MALINNKCNPCEFGHMLIDASNSNKRKIILIDYQLGEKADTYLIKDSTLNHINVITKPMLYSRLEGVVGDLSLLDRVLPAVAEEDIDWDSEYEKALESVKEFKKNYNDEQEMYIQVIKDAISHGVLDKDCLVRALGLGDR